MNIDPYRKKQLKTAALISVVLLVLLAVAIMIFNRKDGPTIVFDNLVEVPGYTTKDSATLNGRELYFSNNRYLARYNLDTGVSKKLTNTIELPSVAHIKPSPDNSKLIFNTDRFFRDDIEKKNWPEKNVWWLNDNNTGKFVAFAGDPVDATWLDNETVAVSYGDFINILEIQDGTISSLTKTIEVEDFTTNIAAYENNLLYYQAGSKIHSYNTSNDQNNIVLEDIESAHFGVSKDCALVTVHEGEDADDIGGSHNYNYSLENCSDKKLPNIDSRLSNSVFTNDGKLLVYKTLPPEEGSEIQYIDLVSGKKGKITTELENNQEVELLSIASVDNMLLRYQEKLYAKNAATYKKIAETKSKKIDNLTVDLDQVNQKMTVSKNSSINADDVAKIEQYLRSEQYNPDLLWIEYKIIGDYENRWD